MNYKLNDIAIATWGMIPAQAGKDSTIALAGHLDLPARIEMTEQVWGDESGVQPYVSAAEIFHGGRDIDFHFLINEDSEGEAFEKLLTFYDFLDGMASDELLTLSCDFGTFEVYVRDEIKVDDLERGGIVGMIPFREPRPDLSGSLPTPADLAILPGIDGIDWAELGFTLSDLSGMGVIRSGWSGMLHRAKPKSQEIISYGQEGYQVTKTGAREYTLNAFIQKSTYAALKTTICNLYALFTQPGTRVLYLNPNLIRVVYVKNGFSVSDIQIGATAFCTLEIRFTEAGEYKGTESYLVLADTLGNHVLTTVGQKILIKL